MRAAESSTQIMKRANTKKIDGLGDPVAVSSENQVRICCYLVCHCAGPSHRSV